MDVVRLDGDTYLPNGLVEGYNSMIWTERYQKNGDFEMHTPNIEKMKIFLPEGSYISLLDSEEVMRVETHEIQVNSAGVPELTVTGRTFETFLENRIALNTYGAPWKAVWEYTIYEIVALILWQYLVYEGDQDVTITDGLKDPNTSISNLITTLTTDISVWDPETDTFSIPSQEWWLDEGDLYKPFLDFLTLSGLGYRNIRPSGTTAKHIEFNSTVGLGRGMSIIEEWVDISQLRLDVYSGLDRSRFQSDREPVIFHYDSGHIENPKYLFSISDWKNVATVSSSIGRVDVGDTAASGVDRRILFVDGGSLGDLDYDEFSASLTQKGLIELAKHNKAIVFDGAISPISQYKYGSQYFLGDTVTLLAQYGFESTMQVAEYIRTEDQAGDRGYPTLTFFE